MAAREAIDKYADPCNRKRYKTYLNAGERGAGNVGALAVGSKLPKELIAFKRLLRWRAKGISLGSGAPKKGLLQRLKSGGKTFDQYKKGFWSNKVKPKLDPIINPKTGQVWKQYTELHHRFIPQRWKWAPNWLKNNRFNLKPVSSLKHAQMDPFRARFAPKWVKQMYNLKW